MTVVPVSGASDEAAFADEQSGVYAVIGRRLRQARQDRGLSLEDLADRADLTPAFLGQIERGERKLSVAALDRVIRALGLTPNELMHEPSKPQKASWEDRIAGLLRNQSEQRKMQIFNALKYILRKLP